MVGYGGLAEQKNIVDAAVKAGVKRFIPSEFGINTQTLEGQAIGTPLKHKTQTVEYLKKVSSEHKDFSWTGISTGLFFDWVSCAMPLNLSHFTHGAPRVSKSVP